MESANRSGQSYRSLRRRMLFPRWRLRTLFLLVTALCLWLTWHVVNAQQQQAAIAAINRYGGQAIYDFHDRDRGARPSAWRAWLAQLIGDDFVFSVVGVGLDGNLVDDRAMTELAPRLARLDDLQWLDIDNVPITDAGLAPLKQLRQLQGLLLRSQGFQSPKLKITDDGLEFLAELRSLRTLLINDAAITGRGLKNVAKLPQLVSLDCRSTSFDDAGLQTVGLLRNLKCLQLWQTSVSDAGLVHLRTLQGLEELYFMDSPITDKGVASISHLRNLRVLDLTRSRITDEGLDELSQLTELRELRLYGTLVTDHGIIKLKSLLYLKVLHLHDSSVTIHGARLLGRSLPTCVIDGAR